MLAFEAATSQNRGIPQFFLTTNQTLYVVILLLLSESQTMEDHPVDSIDSATYTHDEVNDDSTLSSET